MGCPPSHLCPSSRCRWRCCRRCPRFGGRATRGSAKRAALRSLEGKKKEAAAAPPSKNNEGWNGEGGGRTGKCQKVRAPPPRACACAGGASAAGMRERKREGPAEKGPARGPGLITNTSLLARRRRQWTDVEDLAILIDCAPRVFRDNG